MRDYIPPEIGIPLALVLWTILIVLWIRDKRKLRKAKTLWMSKDGYWIALDGSGRKEPILSREDIQLYDQDEDKEVRK